MMISGAGRSIWEKGLIFPPGSPTDWNDKVRKGMGEFQGLSHRTHTRGNKNQGLGI